MKITKVTVPFSYTKNMKDSGFEFESAKVGAEYTAELEEGESLKEVEEALYEKAVSFVLSKLEEDF